MSYYNVLLAKKLGGGGGGSSVTVEPLSVTQNGTYTAPTGTAYDPVEVNVSGGSPETWVLNNTPSPFSVRNKYIGGEFVCNNATYQYMYIYMTADYSSISTIRYYNDSADSVTVYDNERGSGWVDDTYKTLYFPSTPYGTMKAFVEANGTKQ